MTALQLYPHQAAAIESAHSAMKSGRASGLWAMPTGTGKTVGFASFARDLGQPTLVLVHRDELVRQSVETFGCIWPEADVGVVQAERDEWDNGFDVVVIWTKGFHSWGWDMFGEDRARDWCVRTRVDLDGLVPEDRRARFAATVAGFDEAGQEIAHVLTHAEPEAYHGRRYLHLQANAPRAEVSYKYRRVVFQMTVQR